MNEVEEESSEKAALRRLGAALVVLGVTVAPAAAIADALPTGETHFATTTIEPGYNDANGSLVYIATPANAHVNPNFDHSVAPIYLPVYPIGTTVGTLNCEDTTATTTENCPDDGPLVASAAQQISTEMGFGAVYSGGVLGHDHLMGIASTGGDFNINWEPVLVLFTNSTVADSEHVTTLDQLTALVANGDAVEIPVPPLTFHCSVVSAAVYNHGAPV
jgi:hypothetical protein